MLAVRLLGLMLKVLLLPLLVHFRSVNCQPLYWFSVMVYWPAVLENFCDTAVPLFAVSETPFRSASFDVKPNVPLAVHRRLVDGDRPGLWLVGHGAGYLFGNLPIFFIDVPFEVRKRNTIPS